MVKVLANITISKRGDYYLRSTRQDYVKSVLRVFEVDFVPCEPYSAALIQAIIEQNNARFDFEDVHSVEIVSAVTESDGYIFSAIPMRRN
jgi:hypothetical protein